MKSFEPLLSLLGRIRDPRRAEGQTLPTAARVAVFDLRVGERGKFVSRAIRTYVSAMDVETAFREHAADLNLAPAGAGARVIAFDGKTLKGSFDNFNDIKAKQVLTAFAVDTALVLARISMKNPTKSLPCKSCWRNSIWRAISSPATRCIAKKTFEAAAAADAHLIVQLIGCSLFWVSAILG